MLEPLKPEAVDRRTDPAVFAFHTTAEVAPLEHFVGQDRAVAALEFALSCDSRGFNVFCTGDAGLGKRAATLAAIRPRADAAPTPDDWCYVNNFEDPVRPRALALPAGMGRAFRDDVAGLVDALAQEIPHGFASDEYAAHRRRLAERLEQFRRVRFERAAEAARERGVASLETPQGVMLAPLRGGKVLTPEQLAQLTPEESAEYERNRRESERLVLDALRDVAAESARLQEELHELNAAVVQAALAGAMSLLRDRYGEYPGAIAYLRAMEADLLQLVSGAVASASDRDPRESAANLLADPEFHARYAINLFVDRSATAGAPVVEETHPTVANLFGRMEHRLDEGSWATDVTLLRPGALHRANGGYLLLDAWEVLTRPFAWRQLMRVLTAGELRFESPADQGVAVSPVTLEPEPIPLRVKVVLFGPRHVYYSLRAQDPAFSELFKVQADFADAVDRTPEAEQAYARFISTIVRSEGLPHATAAAAAALVDQGSRIAGEQDRLTARFSDLADVLREAAVHARARGATLIDARDIKAAVAAKRERGGWIEAELRRMVATGDLAVHAAGRAIGRIKGLSVLQVGEHAFGQAMEIAATVAVGTSGLIDIEREVQMSGPIHSKGVLILGGYLNRRYGGEHPLAFNATLSFEQMYEEIEGDSASVAELVALLSALGEFPARQDIAITGSINEAGEVQVVGGVTHKVEGFFDVCRIQGLTGTQGVVLPARNVRHLVLRDDVVAAIAAGEFHIYAAECVDEVLELIFERPAADIHAGVERRLAALLDAWRGITKPGRARRRAR